MPQPQLSDPHRAPADDMQDRTHIPAYRLLLRGRRPSACFTGGDPAEGQPVAGPPAESRPRR